MLIVLIYAELGCICSTTAAGGLLRRYGSLRSVLLPYLEVAVTTSTLISLVLLALFVFFGFVKASIHLPDTLLVLLLWFLFGFIVLFRRQILARRLLIPHTRHWLQRCLWMVCCVALGEVIIFAWPVFFVSFSTLNLRIDLFIGLLGLAIAGILRGWDWRVRLMLLLSWLMIALCGYYL
jgi:hypothetical protein